ncbi:HET-domain-containing protein [Paraphaeosphaeria sporulosa]|uniref:HET-domain-containing protein n=1 Tax=Paraphaeosphaeria sporulosa TaxID=1460663 RepID=A0A177C8U1_9PLEO|nr:HET-domain-containing protein [Paraphaeosphaeria sporulosa]OAG03259.1 HET-domain-containing protein [Paraphaeosphaeria sporulosa]
MRLLRASTIRLESFFDEAKTPPYAILSHTWGDEEVSFQDLEHVNKHPDYPRARKILSSQGYYKIRKCCESALADGWEYVWVDTCCIDKTSSAELSESINSMFKWYKNAAICYAHLDDIDSSIVFPNESDSPREENLNKFYFAMARWFTRGWTLQELIAPRDIVFFSHDWKDLGWKSGMLNLLEEITGIDSFSLSGESLEAVSIAQRMSWAKNRHTTRTEDIAYCLLGIFDVNMPLVYGEGEKAFVRLQEEIMKDSDDQTLFAWVPDSAKDQEEGYQRDICKTSARVSRPVGLARMDTTFLWAIRTRPRRC